MFRIILFLFSLIKILTYNNTKFQRYLELNNSNYYRKYMPYRFQFSSNGDIIISLPRVYPNYDESTEKECSYHPALLKIKNNDPYPDIIKDLPKIYSVMGFVMDKDNNYYILDQGIILTDTHTVYNGTPKLVIHYFNQSDGNKDKIYNFSRINLTNSLLTDIAVEHSGAYAYIIDSGNLNNNNSTPGIIVYNLEKDKVYKILNNHTSFHSAYRTDKLSTDGKQKILEYFKGAIGVNCIQISCNDETIYYSSIHNTCIYSVSTKDIKNVIKDYENDHSETKDDKLNNIKVNSKDIGFEPEHFIISSKNNIFALNSEFRYIEVSFSIDKDLSSFIESLNAKIVLNEEVLDKTFCLTICNGTLYALENFLDNGSDERNDKAFIYKAELKTDELNSNVGCSVFIFKLSGANIFIFVYFFLVLVVTIMIIIANSGDTLEKSKVIKDKENEANIDELNKKLKE